MFTALLQTFLGAALFLSSFTISAPVTGSTQHHPRDTAELYIFANCINNSTSPPSAYAAIFWYCKFNFLPFLPHGQRAELSRPVTRATSGEPSS
jgi:hypothetical protein